MVGALILVFFLLCFLRTIGVFRMTMPIYFGLIFLIILAFHFDPNFKSFSTLSEKRTPR